MKTKTVNILRKDSLIIPTPALFILFNSLMNVICTDWRVSCECPSEVALTVIVSVSVVSLTQPKSPNSRRAELIALLCKLKFSECVVVNTCTHIILLMTASAPVSVMRPDT